MNTSPVKSAQGCLSVPTQHSHSLALGKVLLGGVMLVGFSVIFFYELSLGMMLQTLKANREQLLLYAESHYTVSVALFIALYCVVTALSLPGDVPLTLLGGFLFGSVAGALYVNIGATAGATLAFLAARYLLREWVETRFADRIRGFQKGFTDNAFSYLLTLRLIPAVPFVLINLVSGLARVELGTYVRATALGILPCSFVYTYAGRQLGTINSAGEVASPQVLVALTLLGLLAVIPVMYRFVTKGT
jgi:uncharacterized membrane protein YdjX (TVP38/TMEM64 family)